MNTTQNEEITMKIEIATDTHGDMIAHKDGCRDLSNPRHVQQCERLHGAWTVEAASLQQIVEEAYSDFLPTNDDGEPTTYADYIDDLTFAPCVRLPREVVA